jgi:Fis family transcriptional regulator
MPVFGADVEISTIPRSRQRHPTSSKYWTEARFAVPELICLKPWQCPALRTRTIRLSQYYISDLELLGRKNEAGVRAQLEDLVMQMYRGGITYAEAVREFKKAFLVTVLKEHNGNQCKAAVDLRIHRNSLARTISDLQLDVRALRPGSRRLPRGERLLTVAKRASR